MNGKSEFETERKTNPVFLCSIVKHKSWWQMQTRTITFPKQEFIFPMLSGKWMTRCLNGHVIPTATAPDEASLCMTVVSEVSKPFDTLHWTSQQHHIDTANGKESHL